MKVSPAYLNQAAQILKETKDAIQSIVLDAAPRMLVDLGCGTGKDLIEITALLPQESRSVGIDLDPEMIQNARMQAFSRSLDQRVRFEQASLEAIPLEDNTVDCAYSDRVFQHIPEDKLMDCLKEIHRILRAGGTFILSDTDWLNVKFPISDPAISSMLVNNYAKNTLTNGSIMNLIESNARSAGFRLVRKMEYQIEIRSTKYVPHLSDSFLKTFNQTAVQKWKDRLTEVNEKSSLCIIPMKVCRFISA